MQFHQSEMKKPTSKLPGWLTLPPKAQNAIQRWLSFFPPLQLALLVWAVVRMIGEPSLLNAGWIAFFIYGLPLATFRLILVFAPLREGYSYINGVSGFSTWMAAMKIQTFFNAFPAFERALILIPGAYSLWLRLWGSRIGRFVFWTPGVEIVDRTNLDIGSMVVFGNKSYLSPHVVRVKNNRILLYLKTIKIGDRAFIGFASRLGPGVVVGPGEVVPAGSDLYPNQVFESRKPEESREREESQRLGPLPEIRRSRLADTTPASEQADTSS